ncbi:MAG TPA: addiction module protein [Chthoniobacterales bacterium]|nr:addiction module protein [Chthoniobacterales bacterium]
MQIDSDIMTTQQIKSLPAEEKLQIMEAIWEDMRDHYENAPIAPEVIDLLRHRQARVAAGDAKFLDWDQVKSALGRG